MVENETNEVPKSKHFDPDKGFLELGIVRIGLALVIAICLLSIAIIASSESSGIDISANGLRKAASMFRVPVGMFTLSLPFFALLAANHRSEQTKQQMALTRRQIARTDKQILLTSDQNMFSNYFKHIEEFTKYCDVHLVSEPFGVSSHRKLHSLMYPRAKAGDLTLDEQFATWCTGQLEHFIQICSGWNANERREYTALATVRQADMIVEHLHLSKRQANGTIWAANDIRFTVVGESLNGFMRYHMALFKVIDELSHFDVNHKTTEMLRVLSRVDFAKISSENVARSTPFDLAALMTEAR